MINLIAMMKVLKFMINLFNIHYYPAGLLCCVQWDVQDEVLQEGEQGVQVSEHFQCFSIDSKLKLDVSDIYDADIYSEVPATKRLFNLMGKEDHFYIRWSRLQGD